MQKYSMNCSQMKPQNRIKQNKTNKTPNTIIGFGSLGFTSEMQEQFNVGKFAHIVHHRKKTEKQINTHTHTHTIISLDAKTKRKSKKAFDII